MVYSSCLLNKQMAKTTLNKPWEDRTRKNDRQKMPYGYRADEVDPLRVVPNEDMLPFIYEALDGLDAGHSTRKTAEWLSMKTGVKLSHQGEVLNNMIKNV